MKDAVLGWNLSVLLYLTILKMFTKLAKASEQKTENDAITLLKSYNVKESCLPHSVEKPHPI